MSLQNKNKLKFLKKINNKQGLTLIFSSILSIFIISILNLGLNDSQENKRVYFEISLIIALSVITFFAIIQYKIKEEKIKSLEKSKKALDESKKALDEASIIDITDAQGKITFVNNKFVEISKYSREELLGSDHNLLKSGHHTNEFYRNMWGTITFGKIWRGEIKNKAKDGTFYWVKTTIIPIIDENNEISGYTSVRTDITEQKEQQEKLTQTDIKKDEFMSMITHELKTPLSPIMSWAGMLHDGVLGDMTEKQKHGILKIQENSKELLNLINDILDVHKLELGKMNFNLSTFNIKSLLSKIIEDYNTDNSIDCQFLLESEDMMISSDNSRVTQVIRNFVNNALDFLPENDPQIIISTRDEKDFVVILVKDNGSGISEENQKKLFKKFYQVDTSSTREHGGTGLGLSISMGIVHGLKGKIGVKSELNNGSEFFIKIPKNYTMQLTNQGNIT